MAWFTFGVTKSWHRLDQQKHMAHFLCDRRVSCLPFLAQLNWNNTKKRSSAIQQLPVIKSNSTRTQKFWWKYLLAEALEHHQQRQSCEDREAVIRPSQSQHQTDSMAELEPLNAARLTVHKHLHLNGHISSEPGLTDSTSVFFLYLFQKRTFQDK